MDQHRIRAIVRGRVQGVGFRYHTQQRATALGLVGYVRNQADGTVELQAQGPATTLADLLQWLHHGPPAATVTQVDQYPPTAAALGDHFTIQR